MREVRGFQAAMLWCRQRRVGLAADARQSAVGDVVTALIAEVASGGERALLDLTERLDGVRLTSCVVPAHRLEEAAADVPAELRWPIDLSIERVEVFYRAQQTGGFELNDEGARIGALVRPLASVGCYVPGGSAPLFSSLVMTAVPAKVAGVERVVVATPPTPQGGVPPEVAYVARRLGVETVLAVGGAQAIAALALGVGEVEPVDKVVGPGNEYVVEAKRQLYGIVGIDGLAGPTETLVLADHTADVDHVAADLVAQAEHVGAEPVLVTTSELLFTAAPEAARTRASALPDPSTALRSLSERGTAVLVRDLDEGTQVLNAFAPEHACLLVEDPWRLVGAVRNAGGLFLGHGSMEALGDYLAGPSHVMPTGGTARFASFVNLRDFQKVVPYVAATPELLARVGRQAAALARAEGLEAHARAIESRLED